MRGLITIVLSLLILLGTFKEMAIFLSFKINQKYIAENLCVEKDIEESTCNGCCQLKEKINENRQEENQALPEGQRKQTNPILLDCLKLQNELSVFELDRKTGTYYILNLYTFNNLSDIFHPPKV